MTMLHIDRLHIVCRQNQTSGSVKGGNAGEMERTGERKGHNILGVAEEEALLASRSVHGNDVMSGNEHELLAKRRPSG